jgi:hypothetical protein
VQEIKVGEFTVCYHRAENVIPRFPPLAILCRELHTLVIKAADQHVGLHIGANEDGLIQCFLSHNGVTTRYEADVYAHFLFDFNFCGQHFMMLHYPAGFGEKNEAEYELSVLGKSLMFSSSQFLHLYQGAGRGQAVIYHFPQRFN